MHGGVLPPLTRFAPPKETPIRDRAAEDREERELLARFREAGDEAAFEELVRRTESRVRAVALTILRDPTAAEDAAQEAFLRVFRRAADFRGEGPVGAWVCRIAVRAAQDAVRSVSRRERLLRLFGRDAPESEDRLRERADLARAMRALPDEESEAFVLKVVAGMTYREIAAAAGVPIGTVQSRIYRARRRLLPLVTGKTR